MYIVLDQVMALHLDGKDQYVIDGKAHYMVLRECASLEEAEGWVKDQKLEEGTYKIIKGRKFHIG